MDNYWEKEILAKKPVFTRFSNTNIIHNNNIDKFLDYFTKTYFEGTLSIDIWNHYDTVGTPKTNNNVEGYNKKLKNYVGAAHPNIYSCITTFKKEEVSACAKYKKALDGGSLKPPYRRKLDVDKEGKLKIFRSLLEKKHITLDVYISNIIESYDFEALDERKKKQKAAEQLKLIATNQMI